MRETLSKKLRFEVFKRDSFTCQYCGAKAPDVVLHVDHIQPVCEGGQNTIINLVTSCVGCNLGKGPRLLSDSSAVEKQRRQLEELQERREQIELMLDWKRGLDDVAAKTADSVLAHIAMHLSSHHRVLTDHGKRNVLKLIRRFGMIEVMNAADTAFEYYDDPSDALNKLGGIAFNQKLRAEDPHSADQEHVFSIVKRNYAYTKPTEARDLIQSATESGIPIAKLKQMAPAYPSWTRWRDAMLVAIADARRPDNEDDI